MDEMREDSYWLCLYSCVLSENLNNKMA